ncbi:MAG TPA: 16S rRNA (cytosine(1402)-N(4))-methyltransferase RsmH [Actinopolymorphaceae bacterium]
MYPGGHTPVLRERVVALLVPALRRPGSVAVDATVGYGGHAEALLQACPDPRLIGIDRDPEALAAARERLAKFGDRVELVHAVYDELPRVLERCGVDHADGIIFDLGLSSVQVDNPARGFAYSRDVPLDMRMDPTTGKTAADVVNTYPVEELARILKEYGEERYARRIAEAIVRQRAAEPFTTSGRLVEVIQSVVPAQSTTGRKPSGRTESPERAGGGHPARRTFQALRIEVNRELDALQRAVPAAVDALSVGGRLVVLAYHSLEDRLVKRTFAALARPDVPEGLPDVPPGREPILRLLTRGAEKPSAEEIAANPRASSARLRAAERIRAGRRALGGSA